MAAESKEIAEDPKFIKARNTVLERDLKMRAVLGESQGNVATFRDITSGDEEKVKNAKKKMASAKKFEVNVSLSVKIPKNVLKQVNQRSV